MKYLNSIPSSGNYKLVVFTGLLFSIFLFPMDMHSQQLMPEFRKLQRCFRIYAENGKPITEKTEGYKISFPITPICNITTPEPGSEGFCTEHTLLTSYIPDQFQTEVNITHGTDTMTLFCVDDPPPVPFRPGIYYLPWFFKDLPNLMIPGGGKILNGDLRYCRLDTVRQHMHFFPYLWSKSYSFTGENIAGAVVLHSGSHAIVTMESDHRGSYEFNEAWYSGKLNLGEQKFKLDAGTVERRPHYKITAPGYRYVFCYPDQMFYEQWFERDNWEVFNLNPEGQFIRDSVLTSYHVLDIEFRDKANGIAVGHSRNKYSQDSIVVLKTGDGGKNWQVLYETESYYRHILIGLYKDAGIIRIRTSYQEHCEYICSDDDGATWYRATPTQFNPDTDKLYFSPHFDGDFRPRALSGYFTCFHPASYAPIQTYSPNYAAPHQPFASVPLDEQHQLLLYRRGFLVSHDGGTSWAAFPWILQNIYPGMDFAKRELDSRSLWKRELPKTEYIDLLRVIWLDEKTIRFITDKDVYDCAVDF